LVQAFVDRCTRAIIRTLQSQVISWPDDAERKIISKRFQDKYGFANCVGVVDGTVFPLAFKPRVYGEEYWYCKGGYSLHCLIICDDKMRILDYLIGYPGSVHDNRVWMKMDQHSHFFNYFSRLQYLLANSAFTTSVHLIVRGICVLLGNQLLFNTCLAKAWIKIEHCIGLLKNRFPCLRDLRTVIDDDDASLTRIINRITACKGGKSKSLLCQNPIITVTEQLIAEMPTCPNVGMLQDEIVKRLDKTYRHEPCKKKINFDCYVTCLETARANRLVRNLQDSTVFVYIEIYATSPYSLPKFEEEALSATVEVIDEICGETEECPVYPVD
jgi:hypothetical protein